MHTDSLSSLVVSCPAPYGVGGMGRHLAHLVEEARSAGRLQAYFADVIKGDDFLGRAIRVKWVSPVLNYSPVRFRPDLKIFLSSFGFDRAVAKRLVPAHTLIGFGGSALKTFQRALKLGYRELHLESATAHVAHARRMYDFAGQASHIEAHWLGTRLVARSLAEYELADVIWVNSAYAWDTFLQAGIPEAKLRRRHLTVDPRYRPLATRIKTPGLKVVYVGSLFVSKGIPVLLEAFGHLKDPDARLTLIGGSGTSGMRRYLQTARKKDPRIQICPGDPLPHLQAADVCVHPSFSDGFGYGPAEALACGLPVIATEDTGMKELIHPGKNGWIVPTGDWRSIWEKLDHYQKLGLSR